jgi:hypothetical protein
LWSFAVFRFRGFRNGLGGFDSGAALRGQRRDDSIHPVVVGGTAQHPALARLAQQAGGDQMRKVVRERRGRHAEMCLDVADRQPVPPRPHQQAEDREPRRVAELFQAGREFRDLHDAGIVPRRQRVNDNSRTIEI